MEICIFRPGALGDLLVTLPCIQELRRTGARITLITSPAWQPVARGMADQFVSIENTGLLQLFNGRAPESEAWLPSSVGWIPETGFDKCYLFLRWADELLQSGFVRIVREVQWVRSRPAQAVVAEASREKGIGPGSGNIRAFLYRAMFGTEPEDLNALCLLPAHTESAGDQSMANRTKPELAVRPVAIHAGSGSESKNWDLDNYWNLAQYLIAHGFSVYWTLGPADENLKVRLVKRMQGEFGKPVFAEVSDAKSGVAAGSEVFNIAETGKRDLPRSPMSLPASESKTGMFLLETSLENLIRILPEFELLVGNDSGIIHLAACLGLTVLSVFGASDPYLWSPVGPDARRLRICGSADGFPDYESVLKVLKQLLPA